MKETTVHDLYLNSWSFDVRSGDENKMCTENDRVIIVLSDFRTFHAFPDLAPRPPMSHGSGAQ